MANDKARHDVYEEQLKASRQKLQECQKKLGYKSCLPCAKIMDCPIRDSYVKAVYASMNKGQSGGFEF